MLVPDMTEQSKPLIELVGRFFCRVLHVVAAAADAMMLFDQFHYILTEKNTNWLYVSVAVPWRARALPKVSPPSGGGVVCEREYDPYEPRNGRG